MTSSPSDPIAPGGGVVRLPGQAGTGAAEELRVRLVLAADVGDTIEVDASEVESIGQAVLQLLVAARAEALETGCGFAILDPSPAFIERVDRCRMADALGLMIQKEDAL